MHKFLITQRSHNRLLGPMLVTTSPRASCPRMCPLRKASTGSSAGACYAEHGFLGGFIWTKLDRLPLGGSFKRGQVRVHSLNDLLRAIRSLPPGSLWRHNQAGDLASPDAVRIDRPVLAQITAANRGRRGFTYTHYDVIQNDANRRAVLAANAGGFVVNLSANDLDHADRLAALKIAPVTVVLPATTTENCRTPEGRPVVICPAVRKPGVTCKQCKICATARQAIIGFPARGGGAAKIG
ncbi:MAG: hypothetical protein AAF317_01970 [Pseudomonadota bacterium]